MARRRPRLLGMALTVVATVAPSVARANLRAPRIEARPPSSALHPLGPVPEVVVLGETLAFHCGATACDVEARYRITATQAATAKLAFVLPSASPIRVQVGAAPVLVEVEGASPVALRDIRLAALDGGSSERQPLPIFEARFEVPFIVGENTIAVTYQQPLGRSEHDYGYFKKGRFVQFFRYELWPICEWKHAPGFRVDVATSIHRPAPSWWKRTFSKVQTASCRGDAPIGPAKVQQRGDDLQVSFELAEPLPRRLWCEIGDDDLVPKP